MIQELPHYVLYSLREITIHPQFPQNKNVDKVHIPCFIVEKIHTHIKTIHGV